MFYVPLYIEALRSRPGLVFWLATLAQAALWLLVPLLFYAAPPSDLARLLAVGHEFPLSGDFGPPLAYWLAEIAFRVAGLFGVYALSQICVITTYWCVFALGREIVGATHAAIAVLLMVGILVYAVPTPNFGPAILAMALWALVLLFYWRAVIEGRRRSWYPLGAAAALLLLTTDGELARHLELPSTGWLRRYRVRAHGKVTQADLDRLARGITIDGVEYGPVEAKIDREQGANVWLMLGLREGKNREVKRLAEVLGLTVNRLIRVSFGPFALGDLPPGGLSEVKPRVLKDQLGLKLAAALGLDSRPAQHSKRRP